MREQSGNSPRDYSNRSSPISLLNNDLLSFSGHVERIVIGFKQGADDRLDVSVVDSV